MLKAWYIIDYKLVKWQICLEKSFFGFGNSKWVEDLISSTNIPLMFIDRCKIILIGSPHLFTNFCFLNSWQHVLGYKSRCSARSSKCFGHRFSEHLLLSQFKKWYHFVLVNFDFSLFTTNQWRPLVSLDFAVFTMRNSGFFKGKIISKCLLDVCCGCHHSLSKKRHQKDILKLTDL